MSETAAMEKEIKELRRLVYLTRQFVEVYHMEATSFHDRENLQATQREIMNDLRTWLATIPEPACFAPNPADCEWASRGWCPKCEPAAGVYTP